MLFRCEENKHKADDTELSQASKRINDLRQRFLELKEICTAYNNAYYSTIEACTEFDQNSTATEDCIKFAEMIAFSVLLQHITTQEDKEKNAKN